MEHFDVVIAGAGPAGAGAALELSASGLDVLVVEKSSLPRRKPCGGALPSFLPKLLDVDFSAAVVHRAELIRLSNNFSDQVVIRAGGDRTPLLVNRDLFDSLLIDRAIERGRGTVVLRDGCEAVFESESPDSVSLKLNDSKRLRTRFLIGADGATSRIGKAVGLLPQRKFARAFEADLSVEGSCYAAQEGVMSMDLFCVPEGYGWIFPKESGKLSCGIGTWGRVTNLREHLDEYLRRSLPPGVIKEKSIRGHLIPLYQGSEKIATKRVLLAGDSASLVDPVSGEGIRYALASGKLAAQAIIDELDSTDRASGSAAAAYRRSVDEQIGKELGDKLKFSYLAFHASPDFFYKTFVKIRRGIA